MAEHEGKPETIEGTTYSAIPSPGTRTSGISSATLDKIRKALKRTSGMKSEYQDRTADIRVTEIDDSRILDEILADVAREITEAQELARVSSEGESVINEALAQVERSRTLMQKDQREIEWLGYETRAIISKLLAA